MENLFAEIMAANTLNMGKENESRFRGQRDLNRINPWRFTPRDIIIKMEKVVIKREFKSTKKKKKLHMRETPSGNLIFQQTTEARR